MFSRAERERERASERASELELPDFEPEILNKKTALAAPNWAALISGHVNRREFQLALTLYQKLQEGGPLHLPGSAFVALLKACIELKDVKQGRFLHAHISTQEFLKTDVYIGCALVDMYAKCGFLAKAQDVFDMLPIRNVVSWTALITAYVKYGYGDKALHCFEQMQQEGLSSDAVTFTCSLKACGSIRAIDKGQAIHADLTRKGLEKDAVIGSTLVDMYAKCELLAEAEKIFDKLPERNAIAWTALIAGYTDHGHGKEALNCFKQMRQEGVHPDAVTYICTLKACSLIKASQNGRAIHVEISRKGLESDLIIGSTLVDMYVKCGLLKKARAIFDKLPVQDVVLWTTLMSGYSGHGSEEEALDCFNLMRRQGFSPVPATFVCGLKACSNLGSTTKGQELHCEITKKGLEREPLVGNALVDVYAKFGSLADARDVLESLPIRDVITWTALATGYAQQGETENLFSVFDKMVGDGVEPNLAMFVNILNACNHAGLVEKGQLYFEAMCNEYGLIPTLDHYTCMIDLLARAGHTCKVLAMIKKMPFHPGIIVWHVVLGACKKWNNMELGRQAFENAVRLDEKDASIYISMFNIYADASMQEEANKIEAMRIEKQAWIKPKIDGCIMATCG